MSSLVGRVRSWIGIVLRRDWSWDEESARPTLVLDESPRAGWYMLTVRCSCEQLRCYGLFNQSQGRLLIRGKLRRRVVRIPEGTERLRFSLSRISGDVDLPVLRLTPQPIWRVRGLLRRKLLEMHPGYDAGSLRRPLTKMWADYNRLLSRSTWPLVGYEEWIERQELPYLSEQHRQVLSQHSDDQAAGLSASINPAFVPGLWGDSLAADGLAATQQSLVRQLPGSYRLLSDRRADITRGPRSWLVLLQAGDRLAPHALRRFAEALQDHPQAQLFYADEDGITAHGRRHSPQFKPSWNVDLLYSDPHYSHCWLIRADLARRSAMALEAAGEPISLYGLILEASAACTPEQIVHLPEVLYHRLDRPSQARGDSSSAATLSGFLGRQGHLVDVRVRPGGGHRLHWPLPDPGPLVSLIIPTRDRPELLRCCLDSLQNTDLGNPPTELLLIDNGSVDLEALDLLSELEARPGVSVLRRPGPFNYSALNNEAALMAKGELLALLNNDIEALQPGWLGILAAQALRPGVGAVGARLLYEDGQIQHGGVLLGIGGVAGHAHRYFDRDADGYQLRLQLTQQVSAVTAAALVLRRDLFLEIGGFDSDLFAVNYNDVDLCLRLMAKGYRNIYCPDAVLVHHESRTRGAPSTPESLQQWHQERDAMQQRWGDLLLADPHYSPHLSMTEENFSLALRASEIVPRSGRSVISNPT